ncbi:MAG: hypothetical protein P8174_03325 [Gemmatimonadota bacterium]
MRLAAAVLAGTILAGCGRVTGPGSDVLEQRRVGVIDLYSQGIAVTVPDTVQAGVPFVVSVTTYGDGCDRQDGTDVQATKLLASVTPYDLHANSAVCTDVLKLFQHQANVVFPEPGSAAIVVYGRVLPADSLIGVDRQVIVQ